MVSIIEKLISLLSKIS
jgi:hypothetical protein